MGVPGSQSETPSVTEPAILVLEDGTVFEGDAVCANGLYVGEVVLNTALTGDQ
ncbi:MAG TPA: carbamoyl-phosphate synthase domain-containing protein, partial [Xylella fastidiosa subsp. pauca]